LNILQGTNSQSTCQSNIVTQVQPQASCQVAAALQVAVSTCHTVGAVALLILIVVIALFKASVLADLPVILSQVNTTSQSVTAVLNSALVQVIVLAHKATDLLVNVAIALFLVASLVLSTFHNQTLVLVTLCGLVVTLAICVSIAA